MSHPDERRIALYACGDAGRMDRIWIATHLARCEACTEQADAFRRDRDAIRRQASELPAVNWDRLAAEMKANIHVGLEAGECVSTIRRKAPRQVGWRPAFVAAGLAAVMLSAVYLDSGGERRQSWARGIGRIWTRSAAPDEGVALTATRNGIEVRENGSAFTMVGPGGSAAVVVMNTGGSLRARYVDNDTGQVTITNVYAQ